MNDLELRRLSILASWITAPHVKKPLKSTDFYDPDKLEKSKKKTSPQESKNMIDNLEKQMGVK
jgi:hypothetical protein